MDLFKSRVAIIIYNDFSRGQNVLKNATFVVVSSSPKKHIFYTLYITTCIFYIIVY